jgi:hypothetical protein
VVVLYYRYDDLSQIPRDPNFRKTVACGVGDFGTVSHDLFSRKWLHPFVYVRVFDASHPTKTFARFVDGHLTVVENDPRRHATCSTNISIDSLPFLATTIRILSSLDALRIPNCKRTNTLPIASSWLGSMMITLSSSYIRNVDDIRFLAGFHRPPIELTLLLCPSGFS